MKATTYKRILGLFVLTFAFFVIGMPKVEAANDTKQKCQNFLKDFKDAYSQRYLPEIKYSNGTITMYIDPNSFKNTGINANAVKFKLVAMYGKYDDEKGEIPISIEPYLVKEGENYKKTLYANTDSKKRLSIINLQAQFQTYDTIRFEFEPDGYRDPAFDKKGDGYICCEEYYKNNKPCGVTKISAEYGLEYAGVRKEDWNDINIGKVLEEVDRARKSDLDVHSVDCDNGNYAKDSFEYKFCYAKKKAIAAGNKYDFTNKKGKKGENGIVKDYLTFEDKYKNEPKVFKCDKNVFVENVNLDDNDDDKKYDNVDLGNYYTEKNTQYLYGYTERDEDVVDENGKKVYYQYSYDWAKKTTKEYLTCKLKCEESVTVEYGPPVATSAGLCFGYKVRVTSRVVCNQGEGEGSGIKKPKEVYSVCTPSPQCEHEGGRIYLQGGPNDPFDKCVNSCDGGKYTDKCVTKCYKNVYGTSISASTMAKKTLDDLSSGNVEMVANSCNYNGKGYYIEGDNIKWDTGKNGKEQNTDRRYCYNGNPNNKENVQASKFMKGEFPFDPTWHKVHKDEWGIKTLSNGKPRYYNQYDKNSGIPKRESCNDSCSWQGCKERCSIINGKEVCDTNFYLNESKANEDKEHNIKAYETAQKKCTALASCTTTTSEYTIGASYKYADGNGNLQTRTVSFPYSKNSDKKDTIQRKADGSLQFCYDSSYNGDSIPSVINQDGCYACDRKNDKDHWYQTEWTFGDSWFKNKDGSVFFDYNEIPGEKTAKVKYPRRFCLPTSMQPVNSDWWYVYQKNMVNIYNETVKYKNRELSLSMQYIQKLIDSADKKEAEDLQRQYNLILNAGTKYNGDVEYNIFAKTRNFGYFGWNIDINCFYGTPKPSHPTGGGDTPTGKTTRPGSGVSKNDMRVRIIDLANPFPGENGDTTVDSKATQGIAHFNWTNYAKQTSKDVNYKSTPEAYKKWMINKGYDIYSEEYLDYEINLTKSAINEIKKENHKYTDFGDDSKSYIHDDVTSRTIYKSQFLRDASLFKGNNKLPSDAAIKCNNMKNYNSTECEDFEGGNN